MATPVLAQEAKTLRLLSLGDSYTIGQSVPNSDSWPEQLAKALQTHGIKVTENKVVAATGWTARNLLSAINQADLSGSYDRVGVLIGVNNQYQGRSIIEYEKDLGVILQKAVVLAGKKPKHVYLVSTPDWGTMPFAEGRDRAKISREIDQFNKVAKRTAGLAGVLYIEITEQSRLARHKPTWWAIDGLHPSGLMYKNWVEKIAPLIK